jgi:hypothetical protein
MKNTTFLATLICALALTACGGGTSSSSTTGDLPAGKVGTAGDGINAAEFEAIQCGMNKDQVMGIVGDANNAGNDIIWNWNTSSNITQVAYTAANGVVKYKGTSKPGNPPSVAISC